MAKRGRHKVRICPQGHDTFVTGRDSRNRCIECHSHPQPIKKIRKPICSKGHDKSIVGVYKDGKCKLCVSERHKEKYDKNKEEINAKRKAKYIAHPEPIVQFCPLGHDTFKEGRNKSGFCKKCLLLSVKKYRLNHPEIIKLLSIKCDSERRLRIVKFGQRGITKFYRSMPFNMTADHIIPLCGELVSGLHVIWNLQYLSPSENFSKQNKIDLNWASEWYGKLLEKAGLK